MFQLTWYRRHENNYQIASIDEKESCFKQNHIIILPPDLKMPLGITNYVTELNYYVKYLHWNNNGIMDGFIDFKNNMSFLNDEYELTKKIYGKRFDVYTSSNDFLWSNQSFTIQAKSLFKQINGFFFPESSYNEQTMKMLDVYYPRALQWFTIEQSPHEEIEEITIDKIFSRTNNTAISFSLVTTIITRIFTH